MDAHNETRGRITDRETGPGEAPRPAAALEFTAVSREFRSLVARRRDLVTLLGAVFAGLGILLQNALQRNLPQALGPLQRHIFAFYSVMLLVPSLILALRMARLHGGMVLNGMLFARLMQGQPFGKTRDPERA